MMRKMAVLLLAGAMLLASVGAVWAVKPTTINPSKQIVLGEILYFDRYLSINHNQSCATCHDPVLAGFADPLNQRLPEAFPVSVGSITVPLNVGGRNAPTSSYAMFSPPFQWDEVEGLYFGGQFWDGRATGEVTGDPLGDQAMGPFLNPAEMAMGTEENVIAALQAPANPNAAAYLELFMKVYGIDLAGAVNVADTYQKMALAIAAFERSERFAAFTSKYDAVMAGKEVFTDLENWGYQVFNSESPLADGSGAGKCFLCHPEPLFTDFTYDNLGIPKSTNALISGNPTDYGLGGELSDSAEDGKFKVSGLRNLALTPPYGHNGYFETIEEIVHFYNTRDVTGAGWDSPEVSANVNDAELGDLGLSAYDEEALAAFLKTLSDRPGMPSYPPVLP